jgi:hypothetical protein
MNKLNIKNSRVSLQSLGKEKMTVGSIDRDASRNS